MDKGTTVYLNHPKPSDWFEQMKSLQCLLQEFGLVLRNDPYTYYLEKFGYKEPFRLALIEENDCLDMKRLQFYYNRPCLSRWHEIVITVSFTKSEVNGQLPTVVWSLDTDMELDPCFAENATDHDPPWYSFEDVFDLYHLIKKIVVKVGFDLAVASRLGAYLSFGEKGCDDILRFDTKGPCRLIVPYEERRPLNSWDSKARLYEPQFRPNWSADFLDSVPMDVTAPWRKP